MDLSLREAAGLLEVSESTLSRWVDEGLPGFVINGRYRFNRVDLLEWARRRRLGAAALYAPAEGETLSGLLAGRVHHAVPGSDVKTVMGAVAQRLPLSCARDKALAAQVLCEREQAGSTGLGGGIAVPHARTPLVFAMDRPIVVLCFLAEAVDFQAPDGKPVRAVFAVVSPTIRSHLAVLAKISSALHDARWLGLVRGQAPEGELVARLRELE